MPLLAGTRLAVLDSETTGMSPSAGHTLLELARVNLDDGEPGESWSTLIQPGRPIPADAMAVHGITDAMVADAPTPADVGPELVRGCEGRALVFHNASFDLPFVLALLRSAGLPPFFPPVIDTLGLARGLLKVKSNSLAALSMHFGLRVETAHRALGDAMSTARLLQILAARWESERGIRTLAELAAESQDAMRVSRRSQARETPF